MGSWNSMFSLGAVLWMNVTFINVAIDSMHPIEWGKYFGAIESHTHDTYNTHKPWMLHTAFFNRTSRALWMNFLCPIREHLLFCNFSYFLPDFFIVFVCFPILIIINHLRLRKKIPLPFTSIILCNNNKYAQGVTRANFFLHSIA